ncbi:MAG TPA: hypothetical protein VLJ21_05005 [Candidatus Binatia bacterium]|nr:hypothetical protein [Candidatus Binatia bacterium]
MHSRKAQTTGYILTWIIFTTLMLVIIFGSLIFWTSRELNPKRDLFSFQAGLLAERLLYSPDGLAYHDTGTGRSYPGIIDAAVLADPKIEARLLRTITYEQPLIGAKITVGKTVIYYQRDYYEKYIPFAGKQGAGSARTESLSFLLLLHDQDADKPVQVTVEVIQVRS